MDHRLRELERLARTGDPDAAYRYFIEVCRGGDLVQQHAALLLLCEAQHPELMQQFRELQATLDLVEQCRTHGGAADQRHGLQIVTCS